MNVTVINKEESVIYGNKVYKYGQSFDVNEPVGRSLINRKYVALTEEVKAAEAKAEAVIEATEPEEVTEAEVQEGVLDEADLESMSYQDLRRLASQMGVSANGKREELIARICSVKVTVESEEAATGELPNTDMPE